MSVQDPSPIFEFCTDKESGKCGVCGEEQERPVANDYYDRYQYFQCETCSAPPSAVEYRGQGATYILCTNEKDDRNRGRYPGCCSTMKTTKDDSGWPTDFHTAYPIEIMYFVPYDDMNDSNVSDWDDSNKIEFYFKIYKHPDELSDFELGLDLFEQQRLVYDDEKRFSTFLKSGLAEKYKLKTSQLGIQCDLDGGYNGFIGKCTGCGKIKMGRIWGD